MPLRGGGNWLNSAPAFVKAADGHGRKVHGPNAVIDFFEADGFADEGLADKHRTVPPRDAAVRGHAADLHVAGILEWRELWR